MYPSPLVEVIVMDRQWWDGDGTSVPVPDPLVGLTGVPVILVYALPELGFAGTVEQIERGGAASNCWA